MGTFRTTEAAMDQGKHRLERGSNFFKLASQLVNKKSWQFILSVKASYDFRNSEKFVTFTTPTRNQPK